MEFEQKKMAIEAGLTPFLSGDSLAYALQIWEARYAQEPTFALQGFTSELCDSLTLTLPRARILMLQSLIRALNNQPVSAPAPDSRTSATSPPVLLPAPNNDAVKVCVLLLDTLIHSLPRADGEALRQYLLTHLTHLRQPEPVQNALRDWLNRGQAIAIPIAKPVLTQLINLAYVALCESLGPVRADQTLHKAIMQVETVTAGAGVPVRQLL
ncbi:MAG: hypothetical protein QG599_3051 [Pseudomonadota bacterium]|nr:hypothetical protein [Pseudomonadota bacterium]